MQGICRGGSNPSRRNQHAGQLRNVIYNDDARNIITTTVKGRQHDGNCLCEVHILTSKIPQRFLSESSNVWADILLQPYIITNSIATYPSDSDRNSISFDDVYNVDAVKVACNAVRTTLRALTSI